jgi:DNA-binding transcriptional MerR regulator
MRIGDLARRTGASVRSLRYYEAQGLLTSSRSPRGHRNYVDSDVARVLFLRRLYSAGLSSRTIAEVLPCVDAPSRQASESALARMVEERNRLETQIADLINAKEALDGLINANRSHRAIA